MKSLLAVIFAVILLSSFVVGSDGSDTPSLVSLITDAVHTPSTNQTKNSDLPLAYIPRPYVREDVSLNGGGYSNASFITSGGLRIDAPHLVSDVEVGYDTARKTDDNVPGNTTGHVLNAHARAFYRLNGWYFGGGEQWTETKTLKYIKRGTRPTFGGGKDFTRFRLQSLYLTRGSDVINGAQGVETLFVYPSPSHRGHFFFQGGVSIYRFHDTTFANGTPEQIKIWTGTHHFAAYVRYGLVYRFAGGRRGQ